MASNSRPQHFDYFMLRIEREPAPAEPGPCGIVERLGSGEKLEFSGGPHLVDLLTTWRQSNWKMRRPNDPGKPATEG
jgi:hypothetical protein